CWRYGAWDTALRVRRAVVAERPDVVIFNLQGTTFARHQLAAAASMLAPWLAHTTGTLTVVMLHTLFDGTDPRTKQWAGKMLTRAVLQADLVAVNIPTYVDNLTENYNADNVLLVPHGVLDANTLTTTSEDGPLRIVVPGYFTDTEPLTTIIRAFDIVQQRATQPVELLIAGGDNPQTQTCIEQVKARHRHIDHIRYLNHVDDTTLSHLLDDATVVLVPPGNTIPGLLQRASSYGKAIAAPNISAIADTVKTEGYTVTFFVPGNISSTAAAMWQLADNPAYRQIAARQNLIAANGLPMSEIVDWYLLHFEHLLAERHPVPASDGISRT
ncbi:MAG: glycosyltransferase, partial [Chloroflexota bacterium]